MKPFTFHPTTQVTCGENSLQTLGSIAAGLTAGRVLLVSDPGIIAAGHVDAALKSLQKAGLEVELFPEVVENPTTRQVEQGVHFARTAGPINLIVALGGGSSMDCAKGINFVYTNGGKMEDYWGHDKARLPMLPSIGIPTTAGTGSEAQSYALISDEKTHRKMACGDVKARFTHVILDPLLVQSVPREVCAVTGFDALSHALESYVSTRSNPVSQLYAREAWRLLHANFSAVFNRPSLDNWAAMQLGAHFAGMAIENSMLGAAHACANPLTARYNITHGAAVAVMMPAVIRFNSRNEVAAAGYAELLRETGFCSKGNDTGMEPLVELVSKLRAEAGLPGRMQDLAIRKKDFGPLAEMAAEQWTGTFNPRKVGVTELRQLYEMAW